MDPETLRDILDDAQHDLGKHLTLPLRLLPADAGDEAVREAARTALLRTRRGPTGVTDAATLWAGFEAELSELLGGPLADAGAGWAALSVAVERALGWRARLDEPAPLPRGALLADLAAVGHAIRAAAGTSDSGESR